MEKRAYKRIAAHLYVRFYYDGILYTGIVKNISNDGMYIEVIKNRPPLRSIFEMKLPLKEKVFDVSVKVNRVAITNDIYKGIGVEVLNQPKSYLELVDNLKLLNKS
jgi:hypothetical protein